MEEKIIKTLKDLKSEGYDFSSQYFAKDGVIMSSSKYPKVLLLLNTESEKFSFMPIIEEGDTTYLEQLTKVKSLINGNSGNIY